MLQDLITSQMYKMKSKNLLRLGFSFDNPNQEEEYFKVQSLLYSEYHILCGSMLTIMKKFKIPSSRTLDILFRIFDIESKTFSEAQIQGIEAERCKPLHNNFKSKYSSKGSWHKSWNGEEVYLRSSFELDYAIKLDEQKIKYKTECLRIKYFDTIESKYKISIPDFYLVETNTIVEIKSNYTLGIQNMIDRKKSYEELGYKFKLILEKKEVELVDLPGFEPEISD